MSKSRALLREPALGRIFCFVLYYLPVTKRLRHQPGLNIIITRLYKRRECIPLGRSIQAMSRILKGRGSLNRHFLRCVETREDAQILLEFILSSPVAPFLNKVEYQFMLSALYAALGKTQFAKSRKHLERGFDIQFAHSTVAKKRGQVFNASAAKAALEDLKAILDSNKIPFFLCSGTLLAAVRNKEFFPWDYDIDVGVFQHQCTSERLAAVFRDNPKFKKVISKNDFVFQVKHDGGCKIDIFIHHAAGQYYWHGVSNRALGWVNKKFVLAPLLFNGNNYLAPKNYQYYLNENYGNYKKIPLFYSCVVDTPNVASADNDISASLHLLEFLNHYRSDKRKNAEFFAHVLKENFGYDVGVGKYILNQNMKRPHLRKQFKL